MSTIERVAPEILELLKTVSTATLCTQMRNRGFWNVFMLDVHPLRPDLHMAGQALTLRYIPRREDLDPVGEYNNLTNKQRLAIESVEAGDVLVIDARGDIRAATLGNILAARVLRRCGAGIVTDGAFRDSPAIKAIDLPTFARAANANLSNAIHFPSEINVPIACGGVAVVPGDVVVGDADGVIVLPCGLAKDVAHAAVEQERRENFIYAKIVAGSSIVGVYPPDADTLREYEASRDRGQQPVADQRGRQNTTQLGEPTGTT